jgi:hypothetical protein
VNFFARGCLRAYSSPRASCTICEQDDPRRKSAVLGFSTALGSRFSSARFDRAFLGFLETVRHEDLLRFSSKDLGLHLTQHCELELRKSGDVGCTDRAEVEEKFPCHPRNFLSIRNSRPRSRAKPNMALLESVLGYFGDLAG